MLTQSSNTTARALANTLAQLQEAALSNLVETFVKIELADKSTGTRKWYENHLGALIEWLGPERPLSDITTPELMTWRAWIVSPERGLSRDTQHGHIRACRRLFSWASAMNGLPDPAKKLKQVAIKRYERRGVSESNSAAILGAASSNVRDYALLLFLATTGCRLGGASGLRFCDLDLDRRQAQVVEKGNVARQVFFTDIAADALTAWLAVRPKSESDHVFVGKKHNESEWHALTPDGVSEILDRYKNKLGLKGPCSPHQFRHRLGRKLSSDGMNIGVVAQVMGHKDPSVTILFYGGFDNQELQGIYNRFMD